MADLFQEIEDRREDYIVDVVVTFLEIYNEEIRDLLAEPGNPTPRGGLQIREDKTVKVVGLTELRPASADEVKQIDDGAASPDTMSVASTVSRPPSRVLSPANEGGGIAVSGGEGETSNVGDS